MNTKENKISILPLLTVNFIGMLGYSIIMPFLVFLVTRFGGNEIIYGILGSVYPAFQLIGSPILGRLSDTYGRRKILLVSQIGTLVAWIIFIIALLIPIQTIIKIDLSSSSILLTVPLLLLFFARALDGLTGGNVSVANAYLSDISTDDNRKSNFGFMAMSGSLGFILGPAIAGLLGVTIYKELIPVLATAGISVIAIFFILFYLPESRSNLVKPDLSKFSFRKIFQVENKDCYEKSDCPDMTLKGVLKIKNIPLTFSIYFITFLGFSFFYSGFPMFAMKSLKWTSLELGIFFTTMSSMMIVVQGPLLSLISKKVSDAFLVIVGSAFLVINFLLMTMNSDFYVYLALVFFALGNGLMWPSFMSILAKTGTKDVQGTIQGYANSLGSAASIIGLILGGFLFATIGSLTFIISAIMLFVIFIISFSLLRLSFD